MLPPCLLLDLLLDPTLSRKLGLKDWELVIRQARVSSLQLRLAVRMKEEGLYESIPAPAQRHLQAALTLRDRQRVAVRREVEHLAAMMASIDLPLILLKGAAYEWADLPPARCRLFTDFDLLVPKESLEKVEIAAITHGWSCSHQNAYDQRYYRQWMHELPPMRHISRRSVIDIHHNLLPASARSGPDPELLMASAMPCNGRPDVRVLAPQDLILHSAVHLFQDGEFDQGLRDLFDLQELLGYFMKSAGDWHRLVERSRLLNLERSLYYALRYLRLRLNVPVPDDILSSPGRLPTIVPQALADALFCRGLLPDHETCRDRWCAPARLALYVRAHALRMPAHLLLPHLLRKSMRRMHLLAEA